MSIELVIRIWNDEKVNPKLQLLNLIEVFENKGISQNNWKGLTVRASDLSTRHIQLQEPLSYKKISDALAEYEQIQNELHLSVWSAIPCWRFDGTTSQKSFVPFRLEAWGNEFANSLGRCSEVEGNASFSLVNSGPFIALIKPENDHRVQQVNKHVQENLEHITDLILAIINRIRPSTVKAFTAQGLYQPLNAHLVYFRGLNALIEDLNLIVKLWNQGFPGYRTPPLRDSKNVLDQYALHPWREKETSHRLYSQLEKLIKNINHVDYIDLEKVDWQRYDNFEVENGRVVLDYPYWVNSFLDSFYLDLLSIAVNNT